MFVFFCLNKNFIFIEIIYIIFIYIEQVFIIIQITFYKNILKNKMLPFTFYTAIVLIFC